MRFTQILLLVFSLACVASCTGNENAKVLSELKSLGAEATAFCSSYLGIPKWTVTATTVTPVVTVTTTSITSTTIRVDKRTAPTPTSVADCIFGLPCSRLRRRVSHPVPAPLAPFGQAIISHACSLLHVTPATTTVTATHVPTTTTTTTTTTSITTVKRLNCDPDASHNVSGNGTGNSVVFVSAAFALECCQVCQTTLNCVANAFVGAQCQLLVKTDVAVGAPTTPMCPLGLAGYPFGPNVVGGAVFKGPCGP